MSHNDGSSAEEDIPIGSRFVNGTGTTKDNGATNHYTGYINHGEYSSISLGNAHRTDDANFIVEVMCQDTEDDDYKKHAQVNVEFALAMEFRQAPAAINDGLIELSILPPSGDSNLSADEKSLLQAGFNSGSRTDIEVYYVTKSKRGGNYTRGSAFPSDWYKNMTTVDLNDSFIISNKGGYYSAGHEAYHIFSQDTSHEISPVNLIHGTTNIVKESNASVTDTKRLTEAQETVIRNSEYAE